MDNANKIILGIDPGTARMGYGIIKYRENQDIKCVEYGVITTDPKDSDGQRLNIVYKKLNKLLARHEPDLVAIEDLFYFNNKKTLVQVSQAKGVAFLAATRRKKECYSFTPLQVKQAVTGYGKAEKNQVQQMVKQILKLDGVPEPDDAADALAIAICCAHSSRVLNFLQK